MELSISARVKVLPATGFGLIWAAEMGKQGLPSVPGKGHHSPGSVLCARYALVRAPSPLCSAWYPLPSALPGTFSPLLYLSPSPLCSAWNLLPSALPVTLSPLLCLAPSLLCSAWYCLVPSPQLYLPYPSNPWESFYEYSHSTLFLRFRKLIKGCYQFV